MRVNDYIRYEPDEGCSARLTLGVAIQGIMISLSITVIVVTIFVLGSGEDRAYLSWVVFAALTITGLGTILGASRLGKFGAGHILMMASGGQFIGVSVVALMEGGPATLAMLLVVTSVLQFLVATWLPRMRRIITPVVAGTAQVLIAATVIPIAVSRLADTLRVCRHRWVWRLPGRHSSLSCSWCCAARRSGACGLYPSGSAPARWSRWRWDCTTSARSWRRPGLICRTRLRGRD